MWRNPLNLVGREENTTPQEKSGPTSSHIDSADAIAQLRLRLRARGYAPSTITQYTGHLRAFVKHLKAHGITDLRAVLKTHVESYKAHLRSSHLSGSTQAQTLQAVSRLFEDLVERGLLLLNPTAGVQRLTRKPSLPRRVPTPKQVQKLLAQPDANTRTGVRDLALLEVLYGCALRVGELVALDVHDIDIDNALVRIQRGKGRKGRVLPLGSAAMHTLQRYLKAARPHWAKRAPKEPALFLSHHAERITTGNVRQMLLKYSGQAGLKRISPHALRHAAATHMVQAGANLRHVQKLLGHASLTSTQIYTRVVPKDVKATHEQTHPRENGSGKKRKTS